MHGVMQGTQTVSFSLVQAASWYELPVQVLHLVHWLSWNWVQALLRK
jgi:hypothetical protein